MDTLSRDEAKRLAESHGARIAGTVSKSVTLVVAGPGDHQRHALGHRSRDPRAVRLGESLGLVAGERVHPAGEDDHLARQRIPLLLLRAQLDLDRKSVV